MSNLSIAIVCQYELLPSRIGGMDYFFMAFQKQAKDLNIHVDWYFPNQPSFDLYDDFSIIAHPVPEKKIIEVCKEGQKKYDIIITHFVELCTPTFKEIKQYSRAKIIAVDHNARPLNGYPLKKRIRKRIKGILYSKYIDVFIGVSDYSRKQIIADFGARVLKKVQVIHNGVLVSDIVKREHRNVLKPSFVVVSHLTAEKGIQDLIKAVSLLPQTIRKEIVIDVYGSGYFLQNLVSLCAELKVVSNFVFKGSSGEIKKILSKYDYLVLPTYMECFSLTILESLAANVPVITTAVGGNEEIIQNGINGIIVPVKQSNVLKNSIERIYKGELKIEGDVRGLIENEFSIEKMVKNYISLL